MEVIHHIFSLYIKETNFICKVHKDNQSCIEMANSNKFMPRTKHIALKYDHFKSHVKQNNISVDYCRTEDQKTDLLTEPLSDELFVQLRFMLCGWQTNIQSFSLI